MIEPPNSVILLVGREEFTPPSTFAGSTCAATADCLVVGVINVDDVPSLVTIAPAANTGDLLRLGEFTLETEGQLSIRDVYNREYQSVGVAAGPIQVIVWGNDEQEPCEVTFEVREL